MRRKIFAACLVVLALTGVTILVPGSGAEAEACVHCENLQCKTGGDGIVCKVMRWSNGSGVCEEIDGCEV